MSVKGRGARDKGSRAERKVRDTLRTIYPPELRKNVQRIPMSGAGYIKGDVADNNDPDTCYEVKNQERLDIPDWWRQACGQAGSSRTPVLVVTQNHRPFYYILRRDDWAEMVANSIYEEYTYEFNIRTGTKYFFDDMTKGAERNWGSFTLDGYPMVAITERFYLDVKSSLFALHDV